MVDVHGVCFIQLLHVSVFLCSQMPTSIYNTYQRGLLRCSFHQDGQCEGLDLRNGQQAQFPTLFRIYA